MSDFLNTIQAAKQQGVNAKNLSIHIVSTEFNANIIDGLVWGATKAFIDLGGLDEQLHLHTVPGAVEIPLRAQLLCSSPSSDTQVDAIVALGAVIKGGTDHYDYVCRMVTDGINQVMLNYSLPISFGILTVQTLNQALKRSAKDDRNKGIEAMLAAIKMGQIKP